MNKSKLIFSQINQGYKLRDKSTIFLYWGSKIFFKEPKFLFNVTIKNIYGKFFCGKKHQFLSLSSEEFDYKVLDNLKLEEGTIIDVGACIGRISIPLAKNLKGKVISIEANKTSFEIFKVNIKLNNIKNIIPLNLACSERKGFSNLYSAKDIYGGDSLIKLKSHTGKVKVKTDTIDNIVEDLKLKKVDSIKIDVETTEINVLRGAINTLKKFKPKIIFECYGDNICKEINNLLTSFGYKIKRIDYLNYVAEMR